MSSLFELHARVRRLRDTLSYLKSATAGDGEELRKALPTRIDRETCEEWETFVGELREYVTSAENLSKCRKSATKAARPTSNAGRTASRSVELGATIH